MTLPWQLAGVCCSSTANELAELRLVGSKSRTTAQEACDAGRQAEWRQEPSVYNCHVAGMLLHKVTYRGRSLQAPGRPKEAVPKLP